MTSAGKSAAISAVGVVVIGYLILSSNETPSTALATLQYILLAAGVVGLVGSLMKLSRGE
jgi:membrane protein DedA with SNARE-associated domain